MRYKYLERTGLKVSAVACGSHISRMPQEQCNIAYNHALDKGVNLIFTSAAYKVAEETIAKAVRHRRDEFYIVTTTDYRVELELTVSSCPEFYHEHLDMSSDFASRMRVNCDSDRRLRGICPFGEGSLSICHANERKKFTVVLATYGYVQDCRPTYCPIKEDFSKGL